QIERKEDSCSAAPNIFNLANGVGTLPADMSLTRFLLSFRVARHPPESTFEEVGDYTRSLGSVGSQHTNRNRQSTVSSYRGIRGTVRPVRGWTQEAGRALCGVGGSDNWTLASALDVLKPQRSIFMAAAAGCRK